jgi:D-hexose-6-phosphate mutarotase
LPYFGVSDKRQLTVVAINEITVSDKIKKKSEVLRQTSRIAITT